MGYLRAKNAPSHRVIPPMTSAICSLEMRLDKTIRVYISSTSLRSLPPPPRQAVCGDTQALGRPSGFVKEATLREAPRPASPPLPCSYCRISQKTNSISVFRYDKMRATGFVLSCISALSALCAAQSNLTSPEISKQILPSTFKPPQVFRNNNLVRTVNLEKEFPRETINVVVENVDNAPQQDYYLPFEQGLIARVGGLEVRDKTNPDSPFATAEIVGFDTYR